MFLSQPSSEELSTASITASFLTKQRDIGLRESNWLTGTMNFMLSRDLHPGLTASGFLAAQCLGFSWKVSLMGDSLIYCGSADPVFLTWNESKSSPPPFRPKGSLQRMLFRTHTWMRGGYAITRACALAAFLSPLAASIRVTLSPGRTPSLMALMRRTSPQCGRSKVVMTLS